MSSRRPDDRSTTPPGGIWKPLLLGTLVLFAARIALSLIRTGPIVVADEMGYLGNARAIVGHIGAQMHIAPFYRAGYSLLIAPLVALGGSPTFTYHLVLVLNALLVASVFPLLYLLLTRFGAVSRQVAIWVAFAAAVYPALTALSQAALSENLLFPLVCVWLLAFGGLLGAERARGLLWAAALWRHHGRVVGGPQPDDRRRRPGRHGPDRAHLPSAHRPGGARSRLLDHRPRLSRHPTISIASSSTTTTAARGATN